MAEIIDNLSSGIWKLNFIKNVAGLITALCKETVMLMVAGIK